MRNCTICSLLLLICYFNLLCRKPATTNQADAPFLTSDKKTITELSSAGHDTITINSNTDWSIINLPSWVSSSIINGSKGKTVVVIQFASNESTKERSGDINIKSSDNSIDQLIVHFSQSAASLFLTTDKVEFIENPAGQLDSVTITSNCSWAFDKPSIESGITADRTSGDDGINKVHFTFSQNNSTALKTNSIKIKTTDGSALFVNLQFSQDVNYQLTDFKPAVATEGDTVYLYGVFNSSSIVLLNNLPLQVVSFSNTQLKTILPTGCSSGNLTLKTNGKDFISSSQLIITTNTGWTKNPSSTLPGNAPHTYGVSFVFDNKIYYGLGEDILDKIYSYNFDVFDPQTNLWFKSVQITSGMHPYIYASSFMLNGVVYMGSGVYNNLSEWWTYDPSKTGNAAWKQIASFYKQGFGGVAFTVNGKGYAGIPHSDGSLYQFNPNANNGIGEWLKLSGVNFPAVLYSSQIVINNKVYIIGGQTISADSTSSCWEFDPTALTIKQMASAPAKFTLAPSFSLNQKGYVLANGSVYEFDPVLNSWKLINSTPIIRGTYNAAVINGVAYAWTTNGVVYKLNL